MQNQFEMGYTFSPEEIQKATTPKYRAFLKEAGYVDLEETPSLFVANKVLNIDERVLKTAKEADITLNLYNHDSVISRINHKNALCLIHNLGGRVLTVRLMYNLFIPSLKELAEQGNAEAKTTLDEMTNKTAEWLEDLILDGNKVRIGTAERTLELPQKDGYFNRADINKFGYPKVINDDKGEYHYWFPRNKEGAIVRVMGSRLDLDLSRSPFSSYDGGLGVRFAKFF